MKNIEIIYGILIVVLGILTSKSDLKEGRIYNKTLVFFGSASVLLGVLYYGYYARDLRLFIRMCGIDNRPKAA